MLVNVKTPKGIGFVKGKRSTGYFVLFSLEGKMISVSVCVKKECKRISARTTTLIERNALSFRYLKMEGF